MYILQDAIAFIKTIPAVGAVYSLGDDPFLATLLEATKGRTREDPPRDFYRVWIAAYRYLQQSPALHRVKRHDRTELGSYASPLSMLLEQQATEDAMHQLIVPPGQSPIEGDQHFTVSIRTQTEFM